MHFDHDFGSIKSDLTGSMLPSHLKPSGLTLMGSYIAHILPTSIAFAFSWFPNNPAMTEQAGPYFDESGYRPKASP